MTLATIQARDPVAAFAIGKTLKLEGGLSDNPADPGQITNYGVSLSFALSEIQADPSTARFLDLDHNGLVDGADIRGMTQDEAAEIYDALIWSPGWYGRMPTQMLAWKCFDIAVNCGPRRAAVTLQNALIDLGAQIKLDGQIGPKTLSAVSAQAAGDGGATLLTAIRKAQAGYYRRLVVLEPELSPFLKGWLNRATV